MEEKEQQQQQQQQLQQKQQLEKKIGECMGLERAAQKAIQELESRGLLDDPPSLKKKVDEIREEAGNHEQKLRQLIEKSGKQLDSQSIEQSASEAEKKATEMMKAYLGENPDTLEALEFLGMAEGGEVVHYELLSKMAAQVKDKRFATGVRSILKEEKMHLQESIKLAKKQSAAAMAAA